MARKRLSMRKIRDVLRLKYGLGRSNREIGAILRISHSTVGSYVRRVREAGVSWRLRDDLDDARPEAALYPPTAPSQVRRPEPDWARVHRKLARDKGVTLQLLWLEYREAHPEGYRYWRFFDRYREWRGRVDVALRQMYRAGEKAFVDYAGSTVRPPACPTPAWSFVEWLVVRRYDVRSAFFRRRTSGIHGRISNTRSQSLRSSRWRCSQKGP